MLYTSQSTSVWLLSIYFPPGEENNKKYYPYDYYSQHHMHTSHMAITIPYCRHVHPPADCELFESRDDALLSYIPTPPHSLSNLSEDTSKFLAGLSTLQMRNMRHRINCLPSTAQLICDRDCSQLI